MNLFELRNRVLDVLDEDQAAIPREYRDLLIIMTAARYMQR